MRACGAAESAGVPAIAIIASGFLGQARAIARPLGLTEVPLCEYPGVPALDAGDELLSKVRTSLAPSVVDALTRARREPEIESADPSAERATDPGQREVVFVGTLEQIQHEFEARGWMDGLPVIPPTLEQVERLLAFTDREPDELLGVLPPDGREATVWTVAVNGVMAGCRAEYMPLLIAIVECIADPAFRIQDAGSTPGWEPLVIVSGPLTTELGFNSTVGAMRLGRRANSTVGRFCRMIFRNVAGLRIPPGDSDKATFGGGMLVALAEDDGAIAELGWQPFRVDRGYAADDTIVTVQSCLVASAPIYSGGTTGLQCIETIVKIMGETQTPWAFCGVLYDQWHPVLVMSPSVANVFASDGWTKDDIRRHLHEHVTIEAHWFEHYPWHIGGGRPFVLSEFVDKGLAGPEYARSDDPNRQVPALRRAESINIVVAGDPERNQSKVFINNHEQGAPVSRRVQLPALWDERLRTERDRFG